MRVKVNGGKSKVLMVKKDQMRSCQKVRVSEEEMQEVDKFNCLGVMITSDGGMEEEMAHRVLKGKKFWGTLAKLWKENIMSREVKWELYKYKRVAIPTMVYDSETWSLTCGIARVDRVRNSIIRGVN